MTSRRFVGLLVKRPGIALGLWGAPGIGKTFAARALLRETACRNFSLHATTRPSQLARALPRPLKLPDWAQRSLEKLEVGEFVETSAIIDTCGAILTGLAPFVLHLEDVHEAPPERLEFIQTLGQVVQRLKGVGLIVTSRTELPEPFENVQLDPLSSEEVKAMLEGEAGARLPTECLEWIQAKAMGNPLYTLEYFRFLARQGFAWNDGRRWRWRKPDPELMPVTVEALIEGALADATDTPALQDVLGAKAALPSGSSEALWASVSGHALELVQDARVEFERRGILVSGEFAHPLYREVLRHNTIVERRAIFARRAIRALEQRPEDAAGFLEEANLDPLTAFELLERASSVARQRGDEQQSARWMARAVMLPRDETDISLALRTAERLRDSDPIIATQLVERVLEIRPDEARASFLLAILFAQQMQFDRAQEVLDGVTEDAKNTPEGSEAIWNVLGFADRFDLVLERWRSEYKSVPHPAVAGFIVKALTEKGMSEEAIALGKRALEDERLKGWARVGMMAGVSFAHRQSNRYEQAEALHTELLELIITEHHSRRIHVAYGYRAIDRRWLGRIKEAFSDAEAALHHASQAGDALHVGVALSLLGDLSIESGEYTRAEELLIHALSIFELRDVSFNVVETEANLSLLYTAWPNLPHGGVLSIKYARSALRHARMLQSTIILIWGLFHAALAEAIHGQPHGALELTQELEALTLQAGPGYSYHVSWVRAHAFEKLGRVTDALAAFRDASEQAARVGDLIEAHTIGVEVARLTSDLASARTQLCWFEERGLRNGANKVQRYFPTLGSDELQSDFATLKLRDGLRLESLGPMRVSTQGRPETVRGRKRQILLALLLEARIAGRAEMNKLELVGALYPDSNEDQATNALQETVRTTRANLGADLIQTTQNGYTLGSFISSDAEEFLNSGNTNLWRGTYLDGLTLESRDDTVCESLHLALFSAATDTLQTDPRESARAGRILVEFDPYNLDFLELCVRALRATSNHKSLMRLYADARARLLEVGEIIPERWQDFLEPEPVDT